MIFLFAIKKAMKMVNEKKDKIESLKLDIANIEKKIRYCDTYSSEKSSSLINYYHSTRCKSISVDIPFHDDVTFNINDNIENSYFVICSARGESMRIAENGTVICKTCGNKIETNVREDNALDSASNDGEPECEVTCPSCHRSFTINSYAVGSDYR